MGLKYFASEPWTEERLTKTIRKVVKCSAGENNGKDEVDKKVDTFCCIKGESPEKKRQI